MSSAQESIPIPRTDAGPPQGRVRAWLEREIAFFDQPLTLSSHVALLAAALVLIPALIFPLWKMSFTSNQYPDGLRLSIYAYQLEGGKTPNRDDLREINALNHYIGMRPLMESDFSEFVWLPFAIGGLVLLTLRALVIGKMSKLIDVFVIFTYFGLYSLWCFYHRMYTYGHQLDPQASIKVEPFTPPLFGTAQVGNFTVQSYPDLASFALFAYGALLALSILLSWKSARSARA
jgi:copper chaperone NosL